MGYKLIFFLMVILELLFFTNLTEAKVRGSRYLHKPTGPYNVGYKTYQLVNNEACPNIFFKESNKENFSYSNKSYCNQIELAVYYPTQEEGSSAYYPIPSLITDIKSFSSKISESDIKQISKFRSYSGENLPVLDTQFPVIFFSPGYGLPTQEYENILTELVSNGYIVIGVNSQFINGAISFDNAKLSDVIEPETEEDKKNFFRNSYQDLSFVFKELRDKALSDPILEKISWNKISLLGHSLGAAVVARFANQNEVLSIITLDLTIDLLEGNDCHQNLKTPFMHMFSSQMYQQNETHEFPYLCKENEALPYKNIIVIQGNDDPLYSMHMNFCDYSTLQYAPSIMRAINELKKNPEEIFLGTGNGENITNEINQKSLEFFARYQNNQLK